MSELRELMTEVIVNEATDDKVALLLSGGVGSKSIYFCAKDAGKEVVGYTFYLEDSGKNSVDLRYSREFADKHNFEFVPVKLPEENLFNDLFILRDIYKCKKKTDYECTWPMLYMYKNIKEKHILSGIGDGGHFALSKKACMYYKDRVAEFREELYTESYCQVPQHRILEKKFNKVKVSPYLADSVMSYFDLRTDWNELNKPLQKMDIRNVEPSELMSGCPHINYQKQGVSDVFHKLVDSKANLHNYKSAAGILNMVTRGEITIEDFKRKRYDSKLFV